MEQKNSLSKIKRKFTFLKIRKLIENFKSTGDHENFYRVNPCKGKYERKPLQGLGLVNQIVYIDANYNKTR